MAWLHRSPQPAPAPKMPVALGSDMASDPTRIEARAGTRVFATEVGPERSARTGPFTSVRTQAT